MENVERLVGLTEKVCGKRLFELDAEDGLMYSTNMLDWMRNAHNIFSDAVYLGVIENGGVTLEQFEEVSLKARDDIVRSLAVASSFLRERRQLDKPWWAIARSLNVLAKEFSNYDVDLVEYNIVELNKDLGELIGEYEHQVETLKGLQDEEARTASRCAKKYGLKDLGEMADLTGRPRSTLNKWFSSDRNLFDILLMGCAQKKLIISAKVTEG